MVGCSATHRNSCTLFAYLFSLSFPIPAGSELFVTGLFSGYGEAASLRVPALNQATQKSNQREIIQILVREEVVRQVGLFNRS